MNTTYAPGTRVTTPDGPGVVVEDSTESPWTALISLDTPTFTYRRFRFDELTRTPKEKPETVCTPGLIAARAINAHPWLDVVYPEYEDTDLLISPPWPGKAGDRLSGHVEGRATWNHTASGAVAYQVVLAYEGPDGTVEDEVIVEIDPLAPLAWLDLARPVAELMARLTDDVVAHV